MQLLRKKTILFAGLIVSLLISCKKYENPPVFPQAVPRVKSVRYDDDSINYTYDDRGRLIKYDYHSSADSILKDYVYTDTTVTVTEKDYTPNGNFQDQSVYHLNARGLAISMTDPGNSTINTYTYDSDNNLLRLEVLRTPPGATYRWDNKFYYNTRGDMDSSTVFANSTGLTTVTHYPEYDLTHTATTGNENTGLSFLGSAGKHPLKKTTAGDGTTLYTYTYTYDSLGRIATQDVSIGGALLVSYSFTYF